MSVYNSNSNIVSEIGLALIIVGAPLGMYMNFFVSNSSWTNVVMAMGVIMTIQYRNIFRAKFPSSSKLFFLIFLFHSICLLYYGFDGDSETKYLYFHLFNMGLIFALVTQSFRTINFYNVIKAAWLISLACVFLDLFCIYTGIFGSYNYVAEYYGMNEDRIIEAFTMASACVTNVVCSLILQKKNVFVLLCATAAIFFDIYIMFLVGKRTPIIVGLFVIGVYLYKSKQLKNFLKVKYLPYFVLVLIFSIIIFINNDVVWKQVTSSYENIIKGISDIIYGTQTDQTGSAIERYYSRQYAYNYIDTEFKWYNYLIGGGYMVRWIDNPILQSYLDMGLYGLISYVSLVILLPICYLWKCKIEDRALLFACLYSTYNVLSAINSGNPYGFTKWIPLEILAFCIVNIKEKTKHNDYYV